MKTPTNPTTQERIAAEFANYDTAYETMLHNLNVLAFLAKALKSQSGNGLELNSEERDGLVNILKWLHTTGWDNGLGILPIPSWILQPVDGKEASHD